MNAKNTALCLALALLLSACIKDSSGEKVGIITRLSHDGWVPVCKTWEGEIIRGGLNNGTGVVSGEAFHFTVASGEQRLEVQRALESQKEVKILYHHERYVILG